jgi:hypothetical protein
MNPEYGPTDDPETVDALKAAAAACNDLVLQVITAAFEGDQELVRDVVTGHVGDYVDRKDESEAVVMLAMAVHALALSVVSGLNAITNITGDDMRTKYRASLLDYAGEQQREEDGK